MRGEPRLNHNPSAPDSPARSSGHLTQELEAPLRRPEIRKIYSDVCVHDSHQRDVREVQPLGDHLRSEQYVDIAGTDAVEDSRVRPLAARGIEVQPGYARRRKPLGQKPLDLLSAEAALPEIPAPAARTIWPRIFLMETIVADQALWISMVGQRDAAVRTRRHRAAVDALDERRVAAAVEQEDALLGATHAFDDCILQRLADRRSVGGPALRRVGVNP